MVLWPYMHPHVCFFLPKITYMIRRDGQQISLWQLSTNPVEPTKVITPETVYDVVIVGGGITGISTALSLQEAGKKCLVAEAHSLCFGTTGGTTAHLNTFLDTPYNVIDGKFSQEASRQIAIATAATINKIKENIDRHNIDCNFKMADGYLFAKNDKQEKELDDILESTVAAGVSASYIDTIPIAVKFTKAIQIPGQAKFHPVRYVQGVAAAFEKAGCVILENCRVTGLDQHERLEIATTQGTLHARDIIYATHIPPGINLLHLRCAPYRSYAMAVTLIGELYPEGLVYDMEDPYNYYRSQEIDGRSFLIVGGKDHKTAHEENESSKFMELEAMVRKQFNVEAVHAKWSSQYYEPSDGLPYIGHLPGNPNNVYVATGYGGNGMIYSGIAAALLTDIILGRENELQKLFDPNRVKPIAGFTNFVTHNSDVVKQFIGKMFSPAELPELADLAPGEGRVCQYNKQKLAIYKDQDGNVSAVNPTCTHLKCEVKWNNAEISWDCPCHGARYTPSGEVLTGPADHDLEPVPIGNSVKTEV